METERTTWLEFFNEEKVIIKQMLQLEEGNKSKEQDCESHSKDPSRKLTIWIRLFEILKQSSSALSVLPE